MSDTVFSEVSFGTSGPIPAQTERIEVVIDPTVMIDDYAKSFVKEAQRVNPLLSDRVNLTDEEMVSYARFLLSQRVKSVEGDCPLFRRLKPLFIPSFLQYAISMVGRVLIRNRGLLLIPTYSEDNISIEEALRISDKVAAFKDDLQMVDDAMPRSVDGDVDVMSSALIAGYLMSMKEVEHEISAYVAAFLGFKLKEEAAFKVLYRTQYDDLDYIVSAVLAKKELL